MRERAESARMLSIPLHFVQFLSVSCDALCWEHTGRFTTVRLRACISTFPPFSESSIKTVWNQSVKNRDFFRQRNQTPHKRDRYRSWWSLKMSLTEPQSASGLFLNPGLRIGTNWVRIFKNMQWGKFLVQIAPKQYPPRGCFQFR
jgi:hypothetical protein